VTAAKRMIERSLEHFDLYPERDCQEFRARLSG
jgi:hypothetical protein